MVDVEFVTQYLQLLHAGKIELLRSQNTVNLLETMVIVGVLPQQDAELLINGYKFLRRLENRLRLLYDQSINDLSAQNKGFRRAARSLGYSGRGAQPEQKFIEEYRYITGNIRRLMEKYLNPQTGVVEG